MLIEGTRQHLYPLSLASLPARLHARLQARLPARPPSSSPQGGACGRTPGVLQLRTFTKNKKPSHVYVSSCTQSLAHE